eukprot:m.262221 g.262221  ORF g.262221 m.262221 type:complete len:114 (+) comp15588_c0_seq1:31-372(+)
MVFMDWREWQSVCFNTHVVAHYSHGTTCGWCSLLLFFVCFLVSKPLTGSEQFLILGSDGVWDHMTNEEAVALTAKYDTPQAASHAIVKEARKRWMQRGGGYIDDVTAVVVFLK